MQTYSDGTNGGLKVSISEKRWVTWEGHGEGKVGSSRSNGISEMKMDHRRGNERVASMVKELHVLNRVGEEVGRSRGLGMELQGIEQLPQKQSSEGEVSISLLSLIFLFLYRVLVDNSVSIF
ncbi:hypothetical protein L6452_10528 [Arctium lappa]|uniref:Uncharacterized protein n=1 Tax=Arctium lappa TaxID=4217 RepID=A0ACB9DNC9_ARCLA|nr:hypothetical protein L6452_10528 [Arctium lappa]